MLTVQLQNLQFYACHGVYEGESKTGNNYEVNLAVAYNEKGHDIHQLEDLINYEDLYDIVRKRMGIPASLLEEVAEGIIRKIKHQYSYVTEANISICKLQAPIEGFQGKIGITLNRHFEQSEER
jgi:dihydroneopterin aldolase